MCSAPTTACRPRAWPLRTGLSVIEAQDLLRRLALTFPTFTAWAEHVADVGQLTGYLSTVFGWTLRTENTPRSTTLRNFPDAGQRRRDAAAGVLSGHGAREFTSARPVHDALLIEGDAGRIDDTVATTQAAMAEASRVVLDGLEVGTDVEIIEWPDRYADPRGRVMWERVMELLEGQAGQGGQEVKGVG